MKQSIAIIGAGIAGATLAQRMMNAGYDVSVFEKSRGTGGRLSSGRLDQLSADLGAPYIEANNTTFSDWLSGQPEVTPWKPSISSFSDTSVVTDPAALTIVPNEVFLATPRQSALTRSMLSGAKLITSTHIGSVTPNKNGTLLYDLDAQELGLFDKVVVTAPALQAATLLKAIPHFSQQAANVKTIPAWVSIILLEKPSGINADILAGGDTTLFRAIKDSAKPGRQSSENAEIWSLEATSQWSEANIETEKDSVGQQLIQAFLNLTGCTLSIREQRVHRWLYCQHQSMLNHTFMWSTEHAIGACGDWLKNPGIEGAWLSANALADHLLQTENA